MVVKHDLSPAASAVDGEACILPLELFTPRSVLAKEVRHVVVTRWVERMRGRLCRVKQDVAVPISIHPSGRVRERFNKVSATGVRD